MDVFLPLFFASLVGMGHAFEADHLIAVSNMVSKRNSIALAVKDGFFWGLGHTTTIVIVGSLIILSRASFLNFSYFEVAVGFVLVVMGVSRLVNKDNFRSPKRSRYPHGMAFSVGLLHGLAGSGALVLLVMSEIKGTFLGIAYLAVFGLGSIVGMFVAAGLFCIPFTQRMKINKTLKAGVVILSSLACIWYGGWMIFENLM